MNGRFTPRRERALLHEVICLAKERLYVLYRLSLPQLVSRQAGFLKDRELPIKEIFETVVLAQGRDKFILFVYVLINA